MWGFSYWVIPIFSSLVWLAMLIAMLASWADDGFPRYASMNQNQSIAYISDIGASGLKPLFVAMSAVTVVSLDAVFVFERWLRHTGKLAPNTSIWQKVYSGIAIGAAIVGAAGLILLTVFDTLHHPRLHNTFLAVFIGGYIVSAIFICWEYQRLGIHFREHRVLRISFWFKLFFILLELALAIAFGVTTRNGNYNVAAVLEWAIAFIFFFYVASFFIDFIPAYQSNGRTSRTTKMQAAEEGDVSGSDRPVMGETNGYANGYTNGSSRNF